MLDPKLKLFEFHNHKKNNKDYLLIKLLIKSYKKVSKIWHKIFECKHCKEKVSKCKEKILTKEYEILNELKKKNDNALYDCINCRSPVLKNYLPAIRQQEERICEMDLTMGYLNEIEDKLCRKCKKNHKKLLKNCEIYFEYSHLYEQSQQKNGK